MIVDKKVKLNLIGLDGNAFSVMGAFKRQAQREKWSQEEIKKVLDEAMSRDYNYLLATIMEHTEPEDDDIDEEDIEDIEEDAYEDAYDEEDEEGCGGHCGKCSCH